MEIPPEYPTWRIKSLKLYIQSLRKLKKFSISKAFPGHGETIKNPTLLIEDILNHHEIRRELVYSVIEKNRGITVYEICKEVFEDMEGFNLLLGISEVYGHLDLLFEENRIVKKVKNNYIILFPNESSMPAISN
jgi:glyoxylase-like metal-dependent hydrolase (beta-lactamase superfamily II)